MGTEYFRLHPVIGILSNAPVVAGALALLLLLSPAFERRLERAPAAWIGGAFLLTRVAFLLFVVVQMRHVSLDLGTYFETQGWAVLHGGVPYRDFGSSYAPLFPYLMALPSLVRGPLPFFVFFAACDLVALLAVMRATKPSAARAGWIYAAAPVTWYFLVRYGQDEALASAFLALAFLLWRFDREVFAALILGFGFAATKFTFAIFLPPFVLAARRPFRFALVLAATALVLFVPFLALGVPVWRPFTAESAGLGFGPSLWRLPIVFTPFTAGWPITLLLALALLLVWVVPPAVGRRPALERHLLLTGCVFLVFSPKVMPMYVTPFWPFAAIWLSRSRRRGDIVIAALLNLLLGVWWYFDAGGINGMFGAGIQILSALVTAAVPVTFLVLAWRLWSDREGVAAAHA
jgi:hypothetical protein